MASQFQRDLEAEELEGIRPDVMMKIRTHGTFQEKFVLQMTCLLQCLSMLIKAISVEMESAQSTEDL